MYSYSELVAMKVTDLREVLKGMECKVSGKKKELIDRIMSAQTSEVTNEVTNKESKEGNQDSNVEGTEESTVLVTRKEEQEEVTNEKELEVTNELERLRAENERLRQELSRKDVRSIGVTKKVSLTLSVQDWERVEREEKAYSSRSAYLRSVIEGHLNG